MAVIVKRVIEADVVNMTLSVLKRGFASRTDLQLPIGGTRTKDIRVLIARRALSNDGRATNPLWQSSRLGAIAR
jgi:hypothetical protein